MLIYITALFYISYFSPSVTAGVNHVDETYLVQWTLTVTANVSKLNHVRDPFSTGGILGPHVRVNYAGSAQVSCPTYINTTCAAVTDEPCQRGGDSLHRGACVCILRGVDTRTLAHTGFLLFDFREDSIDVAQPPNIHRRVPDLKPDSVTFPPKNNSFPYAAWFKAWQTSVKSQYFSR